MNKPTFKNFGRPIQDRPPISDFGQAVSALLVIKIINEDNPRVYDVALNLVADIWWLSANRVHSKVLELARETAVE